MLADSIALIADIAMQLRLTVITYHSTHGETDLLNPRDAARVCAVSAAITFDRPTPRKREKLRPPRV